MGFYLKCLFLILILATMSMAREYSRLDKRILSTCGIPCATEDNTCLNGGTCRGNICDCSDLTPCSGVPCLRPGNKCLFFIGGTCKSCSNGNYCQ